ncbi:hypothetical protein ACJJTC_010758 [Scirpophaga incertulas]
MLLLTTRDLIALHGARCVGPEQVNCYNAIAFSRTPESCAAFFENTDVFDAGAGPSSAPDSLVEPPAASSIPVAAGDSTSHPPAPMQEATSDEETASNVTVSELLSPDAINKLLETYAIEDDAKPGEAVLE